MTGADLGDGVSILITVRGVDMLNDIFGFGPSIEQFQESHIHHATEHLALVLVLVKKGIVTDDELEAARAQATHIIDQIAAQKKQEALEEFDKENPGLREMIKAFGFGEASE